MPRAPPHACICDERAVVGIEVPARGGYFARRSLPGLLRLLFLREDGSRLRCLHPGASAVQGDLDREVLFGHADRPSSAETAPLTLAVKLGFFAIRSMKAATAARRASSCFSTMASPASSFSWLVSQSRPWKKHRWRSDSQVRTLAGLPQGHMRSLTRASLS